MGQELRFCAAPDGVRLAYAVSGQGPPIVKAGHWLTHLERDWTSPVWRHWVEFLSSGHTAVRYDERGSGLSDRHYPSLGLGEWVGDLEAVVEASGIERFTLLGISQGGPIAIAYAARHPERVDRLVLYGTYARGRLRRTVDPQAEEEARALIWLTRAGWGRPNPAFRRLFTTLFMPGATEEQVSWFDELQQQSCSAEHAARSRAARYDVDVSALAATLRMPALVLHARSDAVVPFSEGRHLAQLIRDARFVSLESANHILMAQEPAWPEFRAELNGFLPQWAPPAPSGVAALTARELEILHLVVEGLGNEGIAAALFLSVRTIERHLSNSYSKLGLTGRSARATAAARIASSTFP